MAFLEIRQVHRHFGSQRAVDGVSLAVERGEFISLLGPSGSGKTTLLRIVAGFERPDAGAVVLDGADITRTPPQRRQMGMVFQSYALFPNLTAQDNVAFGLRIRRQPAPAIAQRVQELLALVGLADKAHRYPHQLSGGEQQRVALARALAPQPRVLLLDEPLSALDARIRVTLRTEIRRIQRALAMTTLYVTHDQEEALALSDRVVVFNRGRVEQIGPPEDIYDRPASEFVSTFVGTVNRLPARITDAAQGQCTLAGHPIRIARLPAGVQTGDAVQLWLRPERISLNAAASAEFNAVPGHLDDAMFLGARTSLTVSVGSLTVFVEVPRDPGHRLPAPGSPVVLYFSPEVLTTPAPTSP